MRKYYIDNLRSLCILLLFPYHTFMIYNGFESFYIHGDVVKPLSDFILICSPWFMPLMFVLAGISSSFSLKKRSTTQYIKERILKLFIPLVFGILFFVPVQTYFAEKFHNGYTGNFFEQYLLFFTKVNDLTGYSGGFTPAHLWFILYLFVISLIALPIMLKYNRSNKNIDGNKLTMIKVIPLFFIVSIAKDILDISGKSLGQFLILFLLGFFILSNEGVLRRIEFNKWKLSVWGTILLGVRYISYNTMNWDSGFFFNLFYSLTMWICILAIIGVGKHYLNFTNKGTDYIAKSSFPIYIFHQTFVVAVAFYVFEITSMTVIQVPVIILSSIFFTFATDEILKRFSITRFMFGMKK